MTRTSFWLAVAAVAWSAPAATAQQIVVVPKPGNGGWDISYSRMFNKPTDGGAEFAGFSKTLAGAQRRAAELKRWSESMQPPDSEWKLRKIFLEGEDAKADPPKAAGPKVPDFAAALVQKVERDKQVSDALKDLGVGKTETGKFAADLAQDPAKTLTKEVVLMGLNKAISTATGEAKKRLEQEVADFLKEPNAKLTGTKEYFSDYLKNVQGAYKRAKDAKEELLGLTGSLAEKKFKEVNDLVAAYNREAAKAPPGFAAVGQALPRMTPVGPETVAKADDWRKAVKSQFDLEVRKTDLDRRKADLDAARDKLQADYAALAGKGKPLDPKDPEVIRLGERLRRYKEDAGKYDTEVKAFTAEGTRLRTAVDRLGGDPVTAPGGARAAVPNPAALRAQIVGTWKGASVQGASRLAVSAEFRNNGTISTRAENGLTSSGTWTRDGNTVQVTWSTGVKVSWQLKDGKLGGGGTTSKGQSWSVTLEKQ